MADRGRLVLVVEPEPLPLAEPELAGETYAAHQGHEVYPVENTYLSECWDCGCCYFTKEDR